MHTAHLALRHLLSAVVFAAWAVTATAAHAAVDANQANQAELEAIKGIGPTLATRILDERKKSGFKDWRDLMSRVKGIGEPTANKLSGNGLTVSGQSFKLASASPSTAAPAVKSAR